MSAFVTAHTAAAAGNNSSGNTNAVASSASNPPAADGIWSRPGPIASMADALPGRYYARHTKGNPFPKTMLINSYQSARAAQAARARAQKLLSSFDEEDTDSSYSDTSSNDSTASSSSGEASEDRDDTVADTEGAHEKRKRKRRKRSSTSTMTPSAAASSVARTAGVPATASSPSLPITSALTGRQARIKILSLLSPLLGMDTSTQIEKQLYLKHGGVNSAYNLHARELLANLRVLESSQSALFSSIKSGVLTAERVVSMSSSDLAPEDLQTQRTKEAQQLMKTTLVRKIEKQESQMTIIDRKREEVDLKVMDAMVQAGPSPLQTTSSASTMPTLPHTPTTPTGPSLVSPRALSEAEAVLMKFGVKDPQKPPPPPPKLARGPSGGSNAGNKSTPEKATKPATPTGKTTPPRPLDPAAVATTIDLTSPQSLSPSNKLKPAATTVATTKPAPGAALAKKPVERSVSVSSDICFDDELVVLSPKKPVVPPPKKPVIPKLPATTVNASSSLNSPTGGLKRKKEKEEAEMLMLQTALTGRTSPTKKPKVDTPATTTATATESAPASTTTDQPAQTPAAPVTPQVHPVDPIKIPEHSDDVFAIPSYSGRLSFQYPRPSDLPVGFYPLPTFGVFATTGPLASTMTKYPYEKNCWSLILPENLSQPQKMKTSKLDTYITFKANSHLKKGDGPAPSLSIQQASKLYPISFLMQNTDPLLLGLFRDMTQFYQKNNLALACDYESSSVPTERQCSVWLIPPYCLHYITNETARDVLKWTVSPKADEWWGILWMKQHVFKTMKKEVETRKHRIENELYVPSSDEDEDQHGDKLQQDKDEVMRTSSRSGTPTMMTDVPAVVSAPVAAAAPSSVFNLMQDPNSALSAASYLTSLLNKVTAVNAAAAPMQPPSAAAAPPMPLNMAHPSAVPTQTVPQPAATGAWQATQHVPNGNPTWSTTSGYRTQ